MTASTTRNLLANALGSAVLRTTSVPDVDRADWLPDASRMTVREAILLVLGQIPRQPRVEVVELMDGAEAKRIRRLHAARAVLMALLADQPQPPGPRKRPAPKR